MKNAFAELTKYDDRLGASALRLMCMSALGAAACFAVPYLIARTMRYLALGVF